MAEPADLIPTEQQIIDTLIAHLAGLKPADGKPYTYDMTGKVFFGRAVFGAETEVPFLSILEGQKPNDVVGAGESTGKVIRNPAWDLMVQGFVEKSEPDPLKPARRLLAEVYHRLSDIILEREGRPVHQGIYRLANRVTDFQIGQGICQPAKEKVSPTAFFYLPLRVRYKLDLSNPFGG